MNSDAKTVTVKEREFQPNAVEEIAFTTQQKASDNTEYETKIVIGESLNEDCSLKFDQKDSYTVSTDVGFRTPNTNNNYERNKKLCEKSLYDVQVFAMGTGRPMYPNPYQSYNTYNHNDSPYDDDFIQSREPGEPLIYDPSRNRFVLKVFSILLMMLLATAGIITLLYALPTTNAFFKTKTGIIVTIVFVVLVGSLNCCIICCPIFRRPPCCYLLLTLEVLFMGVGVGGLVCLYKITTVIIAFVATAAVVMLCITLSCTRFDFTRFLLYVIVAVFALAMCSLAYGIFAIVSGQRVKGLHIAILFLQTLVSSIMFIIELQMVLGGKTVELTTDEWAFAAFLLYTSVMDLFIKILITTGLLKDGS